MDPVTATTEARKPLRLVPDAGRAAADIRPHADTAPRKPPVFGPDRITVIMLTLAAVLIVLTLLARELSVGSSAGPWRREIVVRKIYRTTVVETVPGPGAGTSVSQSVSSSGSAVVAPPAPTTRTSSAP